MRKAKPRTILLSLVLGMGVLQPLSVSAHFEWNRGLFGKGGEEQGTKPEEEVKLEGIMVPTLYGLVDYDSDESGLFKRGAISTDGLWNQSFGEIPTGITNESFDNDSPLGDGLIVMLLSGVGYMALKKRKNKETNQ